MLATVVAITLASPAAAQLSEQIDFKKPERPVPGAGEAMVVMRPFATSMAGDNRILIYRYDRAAKKVLVDDKGKPVGVKLTFSYTLFGGKKEEKALRAAILPAGDYVLAGRTFNGNYTDVFCFGAPQFTVQPGETLYLGDFEMLALAKMRDGERRNAMPYSADLTAARTQLAGFYPTFADRLTAWTPTNGATFQCIGDEFVAYAVPTPPAP